MEQQLVRYKTIKMDLLLLCCAIFLVDPRVLFIDTRWCKQAIARTLTDDLYRTDLVIEDLKRNNRTPRIVPDN